MTKAWKNNKITRFLIVSFLGLVIFSVSVFAALGVFMARRSAETVYEVGTMYMEGIGEQLSSHFETTIEMRFDQMNGLAEVVSPDADDLSQLYEELSYRAKIRDFDYLALCSEQGVFEPIYGDLIQPRKSDPFIEALVQGEKRVVIGEDANGSEVILFGIAASYPMKNGEKSIGMVGAVPISYITDTLSLGSEYDLLYCNIIRLDGTFVIDYLETGAADYFSSVRAQCGEKSLPEVERYLEGLAGSLNKRSSYSFSLNEGSFSRQIYGMPMPYSEWYLLMVMPYGALDEALNGLSTQRMATVFLSCGIILVLLLLIFFRYYKMNCRQLQILEDARGQAQKANRAKSEFLSNMSHDIRTPMNAIVGMTAIAMAHSDDQQYVQNCLRKITLSSKQLLGLINDVLDMSKIESGKMTLSVEQVSLKEIVEGIIGIMQPQIKAKQQSFDVHIDNIKTEEVLCDSVRLNQVLLNLLSNAVKFTPEGGRIEMSMREEPSPKGADYIRIHTYVRDNGIGMTPEFLNKIFDSYTRADSSRVHKTEGAGLGMAITKYIIDAMQGTIEVQSEPDQGTEFHIVFDLETAETREVDMVLPSWNMLIVDDDETLCRTAAQSLLTIGIKAEWTLSGESALQMAVREHQKGNDYQIVLLDWKLPGMDGIQTAREIRRELGEEIPILLISAYDWSELETEARDAGINGFLSKPLFKSTLFYGLKPYMEKEESEIRTALPDFDLTGRKILLAEDNELNWEVAEALLSELGLQLDWAENGRICLEKFQQSPEGYYDAVLMDIRMPIMNGYEATQKIRKLNRSDALSVPIIAMTADSFAEDIQHCLDCGMNAHVAKPIPVQEVARLLYKYLVGGKAD